MRHTCDPSSSVRTSWRFCTKRAASTLLVLAICLSFVSSLLAVNTPSIAPKPAGTIEISKAGIQAPNTAMGVNSSNCSSIGYAGDPVYYWPIPSGYTTELAMRFTPVYQDTLKDVKIFVYDPGDGSYDGDSIKISLYADDGFGLPGTELAKKIVPPGSYVAYPDTTFVDVSALNLVFNSDFHIGISTSAAVGSGKYESILSDSGTTGTARSSYQYQGTWNAFPRGGDEDYNFHIWVTTCMCTYWAVSGHKYRDDDRDKTISTGDQTLAGWEIQLWKNGQMAGPPDYYGTNPVYTDLNGEYTFSQAIQVPPGTYYVREVISPTQKADGWVQVLPATVQASVPGGSGFYTVDFLNDSCLERTSQTFLAGTHDQFIGPEPSSPSPGLHNYLLTGPMGTTALEQFDVPADNAWFGHTFSDLWDPNYLVVDARLCMRITATGGIPTTDGIALGDWAGVAGGHVWGIAVNNLVNNLTTTVTNQPRDGSWNRFDTMTVCLDLDDLPPTSYPANIISTLQDGNLDVFIQDDTEVDWLELTVTLCCDTCDLQTLVISTGLHPTSGYLLPGTKDPDWVVGTAPVPNLTGPAKVVNPPTGWSTPITPSQWVTAKASPTTNLPFSAAAGDYIFQYCFCADTLYHPRLNMNIRTDNAAEIFLNNTLIANTPYNSFSPSQSPTSVVNWPNGFVQGGNVITAKVHNSELVMGLDVEGSITTNNFSLTEAECCSCFTDGDINGDGYPLAVADLVYLAGFLQGTREAPLPLFRADVNGDCVVDSLDAQKFADYFTYGMSVFPSYPIRTCCCLTAALVTYPPSPYTCGDANHDSAVDISDVVYLIAYIFSGGSVPSPLLAGDANSDGAVDISDAVYLIAYIFSGGSAPCSGSYGKLSPEDGEFLQASRSSNSATLKLAEDEAGSSSAKSSAVEMHTDAEVAGVQLEFKADVGTADEIVVQTTERSKNLQLFSGVVDGLFKVGLIDMTGKNAIAAGDGPIVSFDFKGERISLDLISGVICDRNGKRLNVKIEQTEKASALPKQYSLSQNYPNPFNPSTEIHFALPKSCEARVEVLNVLGQTVRTLVSGLQTAGTHSVTWDGMDEKGNSVASGVYFYRIVSDEFATSRKMVLLK